MTSVGTIPRPALEPRDLNVGDVVEVGPNIFAAVIIKDANTGMVFTADNQWLAADNRWRSTALSD